MFLRLFVQRGLRLYMYMYVLCVSYWMPKRNRLLGNFERDDELEPDGVVCQTCGSGTLIDRRERVNVYGIEINT